MSHNRPGNTTALTTRQQILFGLGTLGIEAPQTIIVQLQLYFTKYLGYPASILSNVRGFAILFDAFIDPLVGYISDRTASRFGRRMPYIAMGSLFFAFGVIGMWFAPQGLTPLQFYAYLIVMQIVYSIGFTMVTIPYAALIPELATEYGARTRIVSWRQAGTYVGTSWGGLIRAYATWRGDEVRGFQEFAVFASILMMVCLWAFVLLLKEPVPAVDHRQRAWAQRAGAKTFMKSHLIGLVRSLSFTFRDRQFVVLFLANFAAQAGILAGLWMYTFLLDDWFGKTWNTPFAQTVLVGPLSPFRDAFFLYIFFAIGCGLVFLPVWNWIGRYLDKRACLTIGIIGVGSVYGASYFLFAPKSFPLLIGYCLLQSFFYCAVYVFPASMLADVASYSEWKTGESNDGVYYGASSFLIKLYNAAAIFWTGFALDYIVRYQPGEGIVQSAETLYRMRLLYAFPAFGLAFVAALILRGYKLDRQTMTRITNELNARKSVNIHANTENRTG
ncbi:MAG: MFS transporter [Candidatus Hydrogenedentes bacterium]|nr:MFS transporter [Candidatus Hydrogenedentota bacterium]